MFNTFWGLSDFDNHQQQAVDVIHTYSIGIVEHITGAIVYEINKCLSELAVNKNGKEEPLFTSTDIRRIFLHKIKHVLDETHHFDSGLDLDKLIKARMGKISDSGNTGLAPLRAGSNNVLIIAMPTAIENVMHDKLIDYRGKGGLSHR